MAFSYNGLIYRDLEDQVRYDAEQIQLLKQADVAINENLQTVNESLQTINTEINGKLTKPTNPSAESAVTMLADGTVGTKPLSEIGGGGGLKLYKHDITITFSDTNTSTLVYIILNDTYDTNYRFIQLLERYNGDYIPATISVKGGQPVPASLYFNYSTTTLFAYISSSVVSLTTSNLESMTDTYVEL